MDDILALKNKPFTVSGGTTYLILFIVWPFLALITALANYRFKEAKRTVYLFLIYYGFTFVAEFYYMDAFRYVEEFRYNATLPFSEFFRIVGGLFSNESSVDIIEPLISFTVSRFTQNYHILFAVYALLFGFFYLKSINLLYGHYQKKPNINALIFLIFFTLIIPPTTISVPRMWTAAWIFFLGAYHVLVFRNPKFLFLALGAGFMHWSFFAAGFILVIYYFAGNRNLIYTPIALVSFLVPNLLMPIFSNISPMLGAAVEHRFEGYTSDSYALWVEQLTSQASWFVLLSNRMIFFYFVLMVIMIRFFKREHVQGKKEENWYSFLLIMVAFVNFGRPIPEFGSRMQIVFLLFAAAYVFFYYLNSSWSKIRPMTLIGLFPMFLYAMIEFRVGAETINPWLYAPGLGIPFLDPTLSVSELLFR
jgi:hypothetical protein